MHIFFLLTRVDKGSVLEAKINKMEVASERSLYGIKREREKRWNERRGGMTVRTERRDVIS